MLTQAHQVIACVLFVCQATSVTSLTLMGASGAGSERLDRLPAVTQRLHLSANLREWRWGFHPFSRGNSP